MAEQSRLRAALFISAEQGRALYTTEPEKDPHSEPCELITSKILEVATSAGQLTEPPTEIEVRYLRGESTALAAQVNLRAPIGTNVKQVMDATIAALAAITGDIS